MTEWERVRWASWNLPESMKRGLIRDRIRRANKAIAWLRTSRVDGASVFESGDFLDAAVEKRPRFRALHTVNDIVRGHRRGNGNVWDWYALGVSDTDVIKVDAGQGEELELPVVYHKVRHTRCRFAVISVHNRTRRDDPNNVVRSRAITAVAAYAHQLRAQCIPFIIAGDFNDGTNPLPQYVMAAHRGPDWIYVSRDIAPLGGHSDDVPDLSDHHVIWADLRIPVSTEAPRKLPKENR